MNLQNLLNATPQEKFLKDILGKECHVVRGDDDRFVDLLPWEELNRILATHRFEAPRIRLFKDDRPVLPSVYNPEVASYPERPAFSWQRHRRLNVSSVVSALQDGATLRIAAVDELYEPIGHLAAAIENSVRERVYASAFLCWGNTGAFSRHWDDNDALVLQIAGKKHWDLYGSTYPWPGYQDRTVVDSRPPSDEPEQVILTAGDVLYVPQGCWHRVIPDDDMSLHISFGFTGRNGHDFLEWAIEDFRKSVAVCRQRLPRHHTSKQLGGHIELLSKEFLKHLERDGLSDRFLAEYSADQPTRTGFSLPGAVGWSASHDEHPELAIFWLAPLCAMNREGSQIVVLTNGQKYDFPEEYRPLLNILVSEIKSSFGELFRAGEKVNLSRGKVDSFVWQLVRLGLASCAQEVS
ncbi:JmjC domain-containing protein [Streptomyces sp. NPDC093595]|uniref:JmjC domain-containing protein n=1 Tax=Streptomyces sp. NPDC093595 TaxID=3366045 RepID=UPI0038083012